MLLTAVSFVFVLGLVMFVHELGHLIAARRAGITVLEFGFGYPPRLISLGVRDGVEYTINAIPFGAFVRMLGEDGTAEPGSFASKSAWARIKTLAAGSLMNLLLAAVVFIGVALAGEQVAIGQVVVTGVAEGSPGALAGIQADDIIQSIGGQTVRNTSELVQRTQESLGTEVDLALLREGQSLTVRVVPRAKPPAGEGAIGIGIAMVEGWQVDTVKRSFGEAVVQGLRDTWSVVGLTISSFGQLFRGAVSPSELTGPVGLFQMSGVVARAGWVNVLRFMGFISVNLFLLNLLPIPALDGGRIAFVLLEMLRGGKRMAPQREGLVHLIGLILLVGLMLLVSYYDVLRIASGQNPLP
jgi:regulator of sigma E protease